MSEARSFPSAPDASHDFDAAREVPPPEVDHGLDAAEEPEVEEPSEYVLERHLTPGGEIEQIVHTQLDAEKRANIRAAQERFAAGIDEHGNALDVGEVPGAGEEYEQFLNQPEHERDDFEERMADRFNQANYHELDRGR